MSTSNTPIPLAEPLQSQVDRLAHFIFTKVPGEPSHDEGAIDAAIRIIRAQQRKLARRRKRRVARTARDARIKELHASGFGYAEIGREYGIARQRVEQIVRGFSG